jgi:hypothetical protein
MKFSHRITRLVAVGLAAGALASPVASARPVPVDWPSPPSQPQPAADLRSPDTRDAALISQGLMEPTTTNVVRVSRPATVLAPADGFDWLDAAIGAAGALGLALLAAGGTLLVRRHSHHDGAVAA